MKHILHNDGFEYWAKDNDHSHRVDGGPAVMWMDGSEAWYENNILYRENNPVIICVNGQEQWQKK